MAKKPPVPSSLKSQFVQVTYRAIICQRSTNTEKWQQTQLELIFPSSATCGTERSGISVPTSQKNLLAPSSVSKVMTEAEGSSETSGTFPQNCAVLHITRQQPSQSHRHISTAVPVFTLTLFQPYTNIQNKCRFSINLSSIGPVL